MIAMALESFFLPIGGMENQQPVLGVLSGRHQLEHQTDTQIDTV
jgi:hypothetical protein